MKAQSKKPEIVLEMYYRLKKGMGLDVGEISREFGLSTRTFYRYARLIRTFLAQHREETLIKDSQTGKYRLA